MNKKIVSIISGIVVILAGAGVIFFNLDNESENLPESSITETITSSVIETTTEPITEIITETVTESTTETVTETVTESITEITSEIFYEEATEIFTDDNNYVEYHFRNEKLLNQHFQKHGGEFSEFNYLTAQDYEKGASDVINNPEALFKVEADDGDGVYYIEQSNEFVILSTDGYIRTYFRPTRGIDYFNKQ